MARIIFLADIVGNIGRKTVSRVLPKLIQSHSPDLVIANAENAAGGIGTDIATAQEILRSGVNVLTGGNHTFSRKEYYPFLEKAEAMALRPHNYPKGAPGRGHLIFETRNGEKIGVVNLIGRVSMNNNLDCPFTVADSILKNELRGVKMIFVDFHGEATSEKIAMAYHLDGRVSAVVGTHTHVQTSDERILKGGTAAHTDVGMCGAYDSILGVQSELAVHKLISGLPIRLEPEKNAPGMINGVVVDIDSQTGKATAIERLRIVESATNQDGDE